MATLLIVVVDLQQLHIKHQQDLQLLVPETLLSTGPKGEQVSQQDLLLLFSELIGSKGGG